MLKIQTIILNFIYFFFKLLRTKDKIFFLSRQSNKPSIDYELLIEQIKKDYPQYKIVVITKKVRKNIKDIIKNYIPMILKQMYHLSTSKICIIDGYNISVSVLKHKSSLKIYQIWHSMIAIKKFGRQAVVSKKDNIIADVLKMHENYTKIIVPSVNSLDHFQKAYGTKREKFEILGLPRVDHLLTQKENNLKKIYLKYPEFKNKKIILYAPTFRNNNNYKISELIECINFKKYILIIKLHPEHNGERNFEKIYSCDEFSTMELLSVADYVITDYSGVSVEAAIMNKPLYFYLYDYDEYKLNPGFNIDLKKEFSKYCFFEASKLYKILSTEEYSFDLVEKFKRKYVKHVDSNNTKKLTDYIVKGELK